MTVQTVEVGKKILDRNDLLAERNHTSFLSAGILAVNVMASPSCYRENEFHVGATRELETSPIR